MGKVGKWIKGLFGLKKEKRNGIEDLNLTASDREVKKRWNGETPVGKVKAPASFQIPDTAWLKSYLAETEKEQKKHAIAVAAATAAAADAAVAAAHAAVAVVRLTTNARGRETWAAVKIQTLFRGFLARKALRALKGLVKLQALFRGYLVRKRTAEMLYRIQSLIKTQNSVRLNRVRRSVSKEQSFNQISSRKSIENSDSGRRSLFSESNDKIVEIDTLFKSKSRSRRFNTAISECSDDYEFEFSKTAQTTPRFGNSGRSRSSAVTPARSVCGGEKEYSDFPNYMGNTTSFKAKLRSYSAPKQRPEPEKKKKRVSLNELMAARNSISAGVKMHR